MNPFFKDTIWVYIGTLLSIPIIYLIRVLYGHELSLADYGIFFGLPSFFGMVTFLRDLGLSHASIYFTHKYISEKNYDKIKTLFFINQSIQIVLSIIIAIILFVFSDYIFNTLYPHEPHVADIFYMYMFFWIIITIFDSNSTYLSIFQNQKALAIFTNLRWVSILIASYIGFKYYEPHIIPSFIYFISTLIISILSTTYIMFKYKHYLISPKITIDKPFIDEIKKYSLSIIIGGLSVTLLISTDSLIIQYFLGATHVGIYTTAVAIISILTLFITPFLSVLQPKVAQLWHQKELQSIEKVVTFILNNYLIFMLPISTSIAIFANNIVIALFGTKFLDAVPLIQLLSIGFIIFNLNYVFYSILTALGRPKEISLIVLYTGIFNFIGNIILIHFYGIFGVSIVTIISWIITFVLLYMYISKDIKIKYDTLNIIKIILSSLIFIFINIFLLQNIYVSYSEIYLVNFLINGTIIFSISFLCYLIMLYITKVITIQKIKFALKLALVER